MVGKQCTTLPRMTTYMQIINELGRSFDVVRVKYISLDCIKAYNII